VWGVAIATATFAAVNERELRRRRYDLEALARLAYGLETATEPSAVGNALIDAVSDAFGFQRLVLVVCGSEGLSVMTARGGQPSTELGPSPAPGSVLGAAEESGGTVLVRRLDRENDGWLASQLPDALNLMIVPLHAEGRTTGFLVVEHGMRGGSRIERRVVSTVERFASQSALALDNAWLLEQMHRMASSDGLTGILNRRSFEESLAREVARATRSGRPLSLVMLDIDHFKRLNDTHGHQMGDQVLCAVARQLSDSMRVSDVVARYGGEEFAILLPDIGADDALPVADRLRRLLEHTDAPVAVTASLGVATLADGEASDALIAAADAALYESKRAGRNRTMLASPRQA
jgi:diguanylate cyclase (GGDEF)-like protein